jgi:hypothetical protein
MLPQAIPVGIDLSRMLWSRSASKTSRLAGLEAKVAAFEAAGYGMFAAMSRGAIGVDVGCNCSSIVVGGSRDYDSLP